jgi:hypothetical protein
MGSHFTCFRVVGALSTVGATTVVEGLFLVSTVGDRQTR